MDRSGFLTIKDKTDARGIFKITLIVFCMLSILGAIPYLTSGAVNNAADALFESVSGFTTTGATCISNDTMLPAWLLVFRSFTEWFGGALVLIFLASLLKSFDSDSSISNDGSTAQLYRSGIRFYNIAMRLLTTYGAMTVLCFLLLLASGLTPLGALIYALSVVSTGGRGAGEAFELTMSNGTETVILVFMIFTCINYTVYYHIIKKHFDRITKSTEFFAYLFFLVVGSIAVVVSLIANGTYSLQEAVHFGIFETVSHTTTTGIHIASLSNWPSFTRFLLTLLTYTGGCTASLGGGLKVMRIVILGKLIARSFIYRIHPNAVVAIKMNGKPVSDAVQKSVISHFLTMCAFFIGGAFLISFDAPSIEETLHITSYLVNNAGGGLIAGYSAFTKIVMCILMLAGRLEFYAILIPFTKES